MVGALPTSRILFAAVPLCPAVRGVPRCPTLRGTAVCPAFRGTSRCPAFRGLSLILGLVSVLLTSWVPVAFAEDADSAALPTVILISLDGTTFDQIRDAELETIPALAKRGAVAERLVPVFPTNTFPNHVSLVTGVSPARHGIVNNTFRDPERGLYEKDDDPTWLESEPLWSIAARSGVVSASFHWVGSEGPWTGGHGPRHWVKFDSGTGEAEKVEQILAWLDLEDPALRPRLITAWFHGADHQGHRYGPSDDAVGKALRAQDRALQVLVDGLEERSAFANTTLLLVSDHGMVEVEKRVDLIAALDDANVYGEVLGGGGFATVWADGDRARAERIARIARAVGLDAYLRGQAPAELGADAPRFGDVVVLAPPGTSIARSTSLARFVRGMHGYRSDVPSMGAIFITAGRGAHPGTKLGRIRNLDVAPTVLALLGIPVPEWMEGSPLAAIVPAGDAIGP